MASSTLGVSAADASAGEFICSHARRSACARDASDGSRIYARHVRARRALFGLALLAVVAGVVLNAREPGRTAVSAGAGDSPARPRPEQPASEAPTKAPHFEGTYEGRSDFALGTPACATVDTVLDADFAVSSGETWQLHNQYC